MEAKTCFCSRPPSLLRVCAYKGGGPSPANPFLVPGASPKMLGNVDCLKGVSAGSRISEKSRAVDTSKEASQVRKLHLTGPHLSGDKVCTSPLQAGGGYIFISFLKAALIFM